MRARSVIHLLLLSFVAALSFFLALAALPAAAQAKHPFTFEDMMKLKRVGEPVPSPDGKWVLFSVVDVDIAANKKTPHIWIVPLKADSSTSQKDSSNPSASVGMTTGESDSHRRSGWRPSALGA